MLSSPYIEGIILRTVFNLAAGAHDKGMVCLIVLHNEIQDKPKIIEHQASIGAAVLYLAFGNIPKDGLIVMLIEDLLAAGSALERNAYI
jgi:hypothetical protein